MEKKKKPKKASEILFDRYYKNQPRERLEQAVENITDLVIGDKIRLMREEANLTQAQLAEKIGTQPSQISRIEDADYDGHSVETLRRIAKALHRKLKIEFVEEDAECELQPA